MDPWLHLPAGDAGRCGGDCIKRNAVFLFRTQPGNLADNKRPTVPDYLTTLELERGNRECVHVGAIPRGQGRKSRDARKHRGIMGENPWRIPNLSPRLQNLTEAIHISQIFPQTSPETSAKGPKNFRRCAPEPCKWCKKPKKFRRQRRRNPPPDFPTHIKYGSTALFSNLGSAALVLCGVTSV